MHLGIDLGGTKTEIIALNGDNGGTLFRRRVPSPQNDYAATLDMIAELVGEAERRTGRTGTLGIGIPGTISKATGTVKNANSTWLNGRALDRDVAARLGRDVRVENDANCFAVAEAGEGAARGYKTVFGVIIGTGCGAGIVIDGRPLSGRHGIGGEWGHNPLPWPRLADADWQTLYAHFDGGEAPDKLISHVYADKDRPVYEAGALAEAEYPGPQCYCGKRGCLETWIAGPALAADYRRVTGERKDTPAVIKAAGKGDEQCEAALLRYCDRLARGLAAIVNVIDPDIIVLGGGMGTISRLYREVPGLWQRYIFSPEAVDPPLAAPVHGDSAGVRGAAWLWCTEQPGWFMNYKKY